MPTKDAKDSASPVVPTNTPRMHVVEGRIPREVIRTYYDPEQDCVIDVIKVPKLVTNQKGEDRMVELTRKVYSRDEELQKKYRRASTPVEIQDVVEVD